MENKINYTERYAANPNDAKSYDTARLRGEHLIENLFIADKINLTISSYDRLIVGGAMPKSEKLTLTAVDPLKAPNFLHRRELGIINVGGDGVVSVGNEKFAIGYKEALYLGSSDDDVTFESNDKSAPALFYFNSAPAHHKFPNRKITKADAIVVELGSLEESNHRVINKLLVREVLPTCQLQMGMTELKPGSVWNTMPAHTHNRRMEAYFYFEVPDGHAVCHFMGQPSETRHIWMKNHDAVISPQWSIHSACATHNYTFIWGMAGENMDYGDQDFVATTELK
ncbi:MAG: 5-dehydro-4-deoxy-D-glucuronate isomerase [Rikenellaceae bacterium]